MGPMSEDELKQHDLYSDEFKKKHNINPHFVATNEMDADDNPTGGEVRSQGVIIDWQNGPRGQADGSLAEPNGAFVEDIIYAAMQRLAFFEQSKYSHPANVDAISHLRGALDALESRSTERAESGKLGKHEV
jgi:hypothetical protein